MAIQKTSDIASLRRIANECRIDILEMLCEAKSGHPGGSLSAIDILTTLFFNEMNWDPHTEERDRFILSKGHGVPALYAIFAKIGFLDRKELSTLRKTNSRLQGHPDRVIIPQVEASTGSLGQGLSIAQGMALGMRALKKPHRIYCVMGDGEIQEGQVWETLMSAPKFNLTNLVAILDNNKGQIDGFVKDVMNLEPLADKFRSFNWNVIEIDGHNFSSLLEAFALARKETAKPSLILAHTVKGKGVSFMENNIGWHGSAPNAEETTRAVEEIKRTFV